MKKNRISKVDYTLVRRRQILDALEAIRQTQDMSPKQANEKIDELIRMGPDVPSILLDLFRRCEDNEMIDILAYALESLEDVAIIESLIDIFLDPQTSEEGKLRLLSTLAHYGIDTHDSEFADLLGEAFDNLEAVMERSTESMLEAMAHHDDAILFLLETYEDFPPPARLELVKQFGARYDERAIQLLHVFAYLDDSKVALAAIEYLGKIQSAAALSALDDIVAEVQNDRVRDAAEKSLRRLKMRGIQPVPSEEQSVGEIYRVISSFLDGTGSRILWFSRYADEGVSNVDLVSIMLRTDAGVADCYGAKALRVDEFDLMVQDLRHEIGAGDISYEYALTLLKDALWQNHENHYAVPPTFFLWKGFFRGADLSPRLYVPQWEGMVPNLDELRSNLDRLGESEELYELDVFTDWVDVSPGTYNYVEELDRLLIRYKGKRLDREVDGLLKRYANEVFEPQRDFIRRNLEYSADYLFRQPGQKMEAETALVAALYLDRHAMTSLDNHPFILRMMEESLERAVIAEV